MQGNDIASRVKLFSRTHSLHSILLDYFFRAESVERINLHTEAFGNTGYVAPHVTISVDTQFLAHQFSTGSTVIHITDSHHHQAESQLGHSIGVLSRSIHYTYIVGSSCFQVHIVITGTGTHHNLQFLGGIQHFSINDVTADNDSVGIFHSLQQLGFFTIFLQQHEFVTCCFYFFTDTVYCHFGKRFVCCN